MRSHLFLSAITALMFPPTGLLAVYFASRAIQAHTIGDTRGVAQYNRTTMIFMILSVVLAVVFAVGFYMLGASVPEGYDY
ncbi:hypothetical protein C1Y63_10800 [Corynebacterium sp. 13CS0277]|uniref:CD225/dispanin family protein n=1 Tax=Corynebacterium sp. 13CS0277 TaxID=2071994 RepID=UPI000D02FC78|nr:CD225/dispanin family protein [Corynebacterium sp. 13CS0277]PRQ10589.1 hypothetical protein C1Y63_10800 [Corynebacterium sp. 13CS0277]